jgi:tetratricopeptide (TPR) repeat protein
MNNHLERGLLLYQQERHDMAEQELRRSLIDEPHEAMSHALLALCLSHRKAYREATEESRHAVALGPDMAFAHYALADVLHDRDRYKEAEEAVNEAIRLDPQEELYRGLQAAIFMNQGRWQDALEAAEEGLALDAEDVACNNLRAMALIKLGRRDEAGTTLHDTLSRDPGNAWTHANQGWALLHENQPREALEHFREALRLEPQLEFARAGIVEAMKARFFLYRLMLRFFLWMNCHGARFQWAIILGGYIGYRLLLSYLRANPALEPLALPLIILYVTFASLSWLADPLFYLLLRFDRFGRHALSSDQVRASNWMALCLLATLLVLVFWLGAGVPDLGFAALALAMLAMPATAVYKCKPGWPRHAMFVYSLFLAIAAGGGAALMIAGWASMESLVWLIGLLLCCAAIIGGAAGSWIANLLLMFQPKK